MFDQLKKYDIDYDIYLHTYDLDVVNCPRNNENNVKINPEEWCDLNPNFFQLQAKKTLINPLIMIGLVNTVGHMVTIINSVFTICSVK